MSNVIKAYSVSYDIEVKKTIGTDPGVERKAEEKVTLVGKSISSRDQNETQSSETEEFVEGLRAIVVETLPSQEDIKEQTDKIIEDAARQAEEIIEEAKKEAENLKKDAISVAQKRGYDEGIEKSRYETQRLKADFDEKMRKLQKEYEDMMLSLEPQMAEIIVQLIEKITGILVSEKEEVILYLIKRSIKNMDKSSEYTIRISSQDYEYVTMRKDLIAEALGREILLYVIEDTALVKNQCLIETNLQVINCSLDIQLKNLITDLKLISSK